MGKKMSSKLPREYDNSSSPNLLTQWMLVLSPKKNPKWKIQNPPNNSIFCYTEKFNSYELLITKWYSWYLKALFNFLAKQKHTKTVVIEILDKNEHAFCRFIFFPVYFPVISLARQKKKSV